MKKILLVTGSVRRGRIADTVLNYVREELDNYPEFDVKVADFKEMPLPLIDSEQLPSADDFNPDNENVIKWTQMVTDADAVVILSPEYNHSVTPVLKNAIDWIYGPWNGKPVAFIGYGWVGGARAIKHLRDIFASNIAANALEPEANLRFMKEINTDGSLIDKATVSASIKRVLEKVKETA